MALAPRMPSPTVDHGQQRLAHRPQLVIDFPRLRPRHPTPPDHRFRSDLITSKIISLGVLSRPTPLQRSGTRYAMGAISIRAGSGGSGRSEMGEDGWMSATVAPS